MWILLLILLIIFLFLLKWIFGSILLGLAVIVGLCLMYYYRSFITSFFSYIQNKFQALTVNAKLACIAIVTIFITLGFWIKPIMDYFDELEAKEAREKFSMEQALRHENEIKTKDSLKIALEKARIEDSIDHVVRKDYYDSIAKEETIRKAEIQRQALEKKRKMEQFLNKRVRIYKDVFYGMTRKAFHKSSICQDNFHIYAYTVKVYDESFYNDKLTSFTISYEIHTYKRYGKEEWSNPNEDKGRNYIINWVSTNFKNSDFEYHTNYIGKGGWRSEDEIYRFCIIVKPKATFH